MSDLGNKEIMAKNIKYYMDLHGKTRNDMCEALGVKYTTFTDWVKGNAYPRIDKIELMANYFGIEKSDLVEDKSKLPKGSFPIENTHRIPILGYISAGLPLYAEQHIEGYTLTELNGGAEYFGLRVKGDSMNALRICDGDIIIVRRQSVVENGEIAVVLVGDENATVKQFFRDGSKVTLVPRSTNPKHEPQFYDLKNTSINILGKVVRNQIEF